MVHSKGCSPEDSGQGRLSQVRTGLEPDAVILNTSKQLRIKKRTDVPSTYLPTHSLSVAKAIS